MDIERALDRRAASGKLQGVFVGQNEDGTWEAWMALWDQPWPNWRKATADCPSDAIRDVLGLPDNNPMKDIL